MVENFKKILAIVLSFTTLLFKGPVAFQSMPNSNESGGSSNEKIIKCRIKFEFKKEEYINNIEDTVNVAYKVKDKDGYTVKSGDLKLTKDLSCCGNTDFELKLEQGKEINSFNLCDQTVCFKPSNNFDVNSLKSVKLILDTESKAKYMFKSADTKSDSDSELSFDFEKDGGSDDGVKINLIQKPFSVLLRPLQLIPTNDHVETSYTARKINDADLGRSLNNKDHSKITLPVMDFFLYPPKSVKELFEVKDKASAFFFGNSTMHTGVDSRVTGIGCCSRVNATTNAAFLGFVAILFFIGIVFTGELWRQDVNIEKLVWCKGPEHECTVYKTKNGEELYYKWTTEKGSLFGSLLENEEARMDFAILIGMIFGLLYTIRQLRVTCSKSCCDCYPYKSSDYGCSCGYGCCSDGNSCVGCVNVCNCGEENCCMECCPCDNGGFAIDFCGSYGAGGCCTKPIYEEFITGNTGEVLAGIVDKQYFDELLGEFDKKTIDKMHRGLFKSEDRNSTGEVDIFRANSLTFSKHKEGGKIVVKFNGASKNVKSLRMLDMLGRITGQKITENGLINVTEGGDPNFDKFINEIAKWEDNKMAPQWGKFYEGFMHYVNENPPTLGAERNFGLVIIGNFCRFCDSIDNSYNILQKNRQQQNHQQN